MGIKLSNLYLWREKSSQTFPWDRFLNKEYLEYEKKRIDDCKNWKLIFDRASLKSKLPEVYYYVVPLEMSSSWKASIAEKGSYNFVGLSALKNCLQSDMICLIPNNVELPKDYSLLRLISLKKEEIFNRKENQAEYVIICDVFSEEDYSKAYLFDIPDFKNPVGTFLKENLINDKNIINPFQATISGSPYVINKKGGVSYSGLYEKSPFADELMITLKMMQPYEFSDIQNEFPISLMNGKSFSHIKGINFLLAEKSVIGSNYYTSFNSKNYSRLNEALIKRNAFKGEYGIACTLNMKKADLRDILSKFVKTDIMHPFKKDQIKYSDVDLTITQKSIDENLWLQIIKQKQIKPILNNISEERKLRKNLSEQWNIVYESVGLKKDSEHEIRQLSSISFENSLRVAQALSRDKQENSVSEKSLNQSYEIFVESSDGLINNEEIQKYIQRIIPERIESRKINAIRFELSSNLLDINALYENVKDTFKDIYELQEFVDKLKLRGDLYEPMRGSYLWI